MNIAPGNIIQSLWIGKQLSVMEQLCINSYLKNGHSFHLYVYDTVENIPDGTELHYANEIIEKERIFLDSRGTVASFADWFRYKLLHDKGGCWTDLDMVCLKPITIKEKYGFSSQYEPDGRNIVNIGFIQASAGAEFLKKMLDFISNRLEQANIPWGMFGPSLLQSTLKNYDCANFIQSPAAFCPVNWFETYKLITKQDIVFGQDTYAVHLWNEIWRLGYLNKDAIYHPESIYEQLKAKYL